MERLHASTVVEQSGRSKRTIACVFPRPRRRRRCLLCRFCACSALGEMTTRLCNLSKEEAQEAFEHLVETQASKWANDLDSYGPLPMEKRLAARYHPAELKWREEEISAQEETLEQQKEEFGARETALKQREDELQKAEEEFSNEAAKAYGATQPDDIITLNVGGTRLQTLRSTLCVMEGSPLASMFSGRWDGSLVKDDQGAFFIDQPYEHFKALLDFLRSCKLPEGNGPRPSIESVAGNIASNPSFMRMVDYYNGIPDSSNGALPPGWKEFLDPVSEGKYYWNATTGESSWDKPK